MSQITDWKPIDRINYISDMVEELQKIAAGGNLRLLANLLSATALETIEIRRIHFDQRSIRPK